MPHTIWRYRFSTGFACGAIVSAAAIVYAFNPAARVHATAQPQSEPQFFVTGDQFSATVWRLDTGGTLTCVSHNLCREPTVAPERIEPGEGGKREGRAPRGPRVPAGPSTPPPDWPDD